MVRLPTPQSAGPVACGRCSGLMNSMAALEDITWVSQPAVWRLAASLCQWLLSCQPCIMPTLCHANPVLWASATGRAAARRLPGGELPRARGATRPRRPARCRHRAGTDGAAFGCCTDIGQIPIRPNQCVLHRVCIASETVFFCSHILVLPSPKRCRSGADTDMLVLSGVQTETPAQLATRNEQRRKQKLPKVLRLVLPQPDHRETVRNACC